jgi:hypothetical protein
MGLQLLHAFALGDAERICCVDALFLFRGGLPEQPLFTGAATRIEPRCWRAAKLWIERR